MDAHELEMERKKNLEYLDSILNTYRSAERRSKKILGFIIVVGIIALYFVFFDLFGGIWGYVLTIAIIAIGAYCVSTLGISFRNNTMPDGELAYQACVTMEILIAINHGTYRQNGAHIISTGSGKHHTLYKQFILLYPGYRCKALERLSKIEVKQSDIFSRG